MKIATRSTLAGTLGALALSLTACGTSTLTAADVSSKADAILMADNPDIAKGTMDCPGLTVKEGNQVRCTRTVTANGITATIGVAVTVSSVNGSKYQLAVKVDDKAQAVSASGDQVSADLASQLSARGVATDQVVCPDLSGTVGASVGCTVTAGGELRTFKATVTSVDLAQGGMNYSFTLAP